MHIVFHALRRTALAAAFLLSTGAALAQVEVTDAWARSTVEAQKASGAFMKLKSAEGAKLVGVKSPAAAVVELHEMAMQGDVMKMRAVDALDLPAGQVVELKPGSYHVMLIELKAPLKAGDSVPITLEVQDKNGTRRQVEVKATVRPLSAAPTASAVK
jgi:periplasmic copper chaperone A